jgi:hypothetical protein
VIRPQPTQRIEAAPDRDETVVIVERLRDLVVGERSETEVEAAADRCLSPRFEDLVRATATACARRADRQRVRRLAMANGSSRPLL